MTIGEAIRAARQKAGMTQAQLASASGLGRQFINEVENGGTLTRASLEAIATALGVDPFTLDPTYVPDMSGGQSFSADPRKNPFKLNVTS